LRCEGVFSLKEAPSSEVIAGGGREGCEKEKEEKKGKRKKEANTCLAFSAQTYACRFGITQPLF